MNDSITLDLNALDTMLGKLRLQTFVRNHTSFADDARQGHHTYEQYLFDLAMHEVEQRDRNRYVQRISGPF